MAAQNIDNFGFVRKRLAMRALQLKVWVDGLTVTIDGLIPIGNFDKLTQQLRRREVLEKYQLLPL